MALHTTSSIPHAGERDLERPWVVCLCAEWCDTCREFRGAFERLAEGDAQAMYVWLDIEDDSALLGDLDIENFPTLAMYAGGRPVFYGVALPQEGVVQRMVTALRASPPKSVDAPEAIERLPQALRELQD
jgi:thioredoxin reductase (NADPH)